MAYVSRNIDTILDEWVLLADRRPLVLRGARQTGKTAAARRLGATFDLFVELNLDRLGDRMLVAQCRSAAEFLVAVRAHANVEKLPASTLIFLDEIQSLPAATGLLRYLYEDHPEVAIVVAGSLLDMRLRDAGFEFPVGRVTFRYVRPFTVLEAFRATGRSTLAGMIEEACRTFTPLGGALHGQALAGLEAYLRTGGMPKAVVSGDFGLAAQVHSDLLLAYAEDILRFPGVRDQDTVQQAFAALSQHYGLRFKYERLVRGTRGDTVRRALARFESAMLVRIVTPTAETTCPLHARTMAAPKLLPLDIGLALATIGTPPAQLRAENLDTLLDGRVAEMLVGQQIFGSRRKHDDPLHFWSREDSEAEVDFLVSGPAGLMPVEVKSAASGSLRSLHQFMLRSGRAWGVCCSTANIGIEQHEVSLGGKMLAYQLFRLPLYAAELLESLDFPLQSAA